MTFTQLGFVKKVWQPFHLLLFALLIFGPLCFFLNVRWRNERRTSLGEYRVNLLPNTTCIHWFCCCFSRRSQAAGHYWACVSLEIVLWETETAQTFSKVDLRSRVSWEKCSSLQNHIPRDSARGVWYWAFGVPSCRLFGLLTWLIFFVFVAFKIVFAHQTDRSWNERLTFSRVLHDVAIKWTVCGCIILVIRIATRTARNLLVWKVTGWKREGNFADQGSLFEEPFAEAGLAHARFCKMLSHTF